MILKIGIEIPYTETQDRDAIVRLAREAEDLGYHAIWASEVYTYDAFTTLTYIAAKTSRILVGTNIAQIYARTPALTATTAASLDQLSDGRFILGLGASGPQVIEGWHGVEYSKPVRRTREIIEMSRIIWRGDRLEYDGELYQLPGGKTKGGKGLKLINKGHRENIPVYVASLGPKNVEMTFEVADGWLPYPYSTRMAREVFKESIDAGLAKRDPSLGEVVISPFTPFFAGDKGMGLEAARGVLGFYIGGMGSKEQNFYNRLAQRYGYVEEAKRVQEMFLSGDKAGAIAATPDAFVDECSLLGNEAELTERLRAFADTGATELLITPLTGDPEHRLEMLRTLAKANV